MIIKRAATKSRRCDREASRHFKPAIPPAPLSRLRPYSSESSDSLGHPQGLEAPMGNKDKGGRHTKKVAARLDVRLGG